MYLLAQIWWLLLLAFLLGALLGYVVWRACGLPRLQSRTSGERRQLEDRVATLERENARLDAAATDAGATIRRLEAERAADAVSRANAQPSDADALVRTNVAAPAVPLDGSAPPPRRSTPAPSAEQSPDSGSNGLLAAPRDGKPDNLRLIRGIGPRLEKTLNAIGVFHFDQIASWTERDLAIVDSRLGDFAGRAVRDKWIEQSRKLADRVRGSEEAGNATS